MGGKGRKRREKNYLAAHGGNRGLPPPPDPSSVNAIPSKLRMLMSLTGDKEISTWKKNGNGLRNSDKTLNLEDNEKHELTSSQLDNADSSDEPLQSSIPEKRKKKRKRNQVNDLRFNTLPGEATSSKRKERRKQRLEEKKKKRKRNQEEEEHTDFPVRDHVKFGDVVQAPPKLVVVPKALKNLQNASQERLRIQAVEAYRKRKGRPGFQLPSTIAAAVVSSNQ